MFLLRNWLTLSIVPFPPGMTPSAGANFSLEALTQNVNLYAEKVALIAATGADLALTTANVVDKNIVLTGSPPGAFTITLPSTTTMLDALGPTMPLDGSFFFAFQVWNNGTGQTATLTAGDADTTLVGDAVVLTDNVGRWIIRVDPVVSSAIGRPTTLTVTRVATSLSVSSGGGGNPAPPDRSVQFNDGGAFGGFGTWILADDDGNPNTLTVPGWGSFDGVEFNNNLNNIVVGYRSLWSNVLGRDNVAVGYLSLYSNIGDGFLGGNENVAVGTKSLYANQYGVDNTAIGYFALAANVNGNINTAIGSGALQSNVIGQANVAVGWDAMYNNDSNGTGFGTQNVAVGTKAFYNNINGQDNVALGNTALFTSTDGKQNVAIGSEAGVFLLGDNNVAIGFAADGGDDPVSASNTSVGANAYGYNRTGHDNVGLGIVGFEPTRIDPTRQSKTDTKMVFIGNYATRVGRPTDTPMTNGIAIGYGAEVPNDNTAVIGNNALTTAYFGSVSANAYVHAAGYFAGGNQGITTSITTASLVGKTITVVNGIITGFA